MKVPMRVVLLWSLAVLLVCAEGPSQLLPPEAVKSELAVLRPQAIVLGSGPKEIHSFIDPKCEMSRRYMQFVMGRPSMMERYTYYFYLYELKRLDSEGYIGYILESADPAALLKSVMLKDFHPDGAQEFIADETTEQRIETIADTARRIGVNKRPYIIFNGKVK
jgi:hypothetical protein